MSLTQNEKKERLKHYLKREEIRIPLLQEAMEAVKKYYQDSKKSNLEHFEKIDNVILFLLIMERDMSVLILNYLKIFTNNWEQKYIARQIALLVYEMSQDIPQLLNGNFRISLRTIPLWDGAEEELNKITKSLHKFNEVNRIMLEDIRHFVIAHRDQDAFKQIEIIEKLDPDEIYKIVEKLYEIIRPLVDFLLRVLDIMGNPHVIVHHLSEAIEKKKKGTA